MSDPPNNIQNTQSLDDLYAGTLKNSLKSHITYHTILNKIATAIIQLPEFQRLKQGSTVDHELVHTVCCITEDLATANRKSEKVDKQALVVEAITKVFPLQPNEVLTLQNQIQYLYNNDLIKRSKFIRRIFKKLKNTCQKFIT